MQTTAVVIEKPGKIALRDLALSAPGPEDAVVEIAVSGVSTGTEKLLWSGTMPAFPGLGYPLVPGYESVGTVVSAGARSGLSEGQRVFVPGASCYGEVRGLFGGTAERVVAPGGRLVALPEGIGNDAALLALAATAHHALAKSAALPDLIIGHGVLGRLVARLAVALGASPAVWEANPARRDGAKGYPVIAAEDDPRHDCGQIVDVSGDAALIDTLIARLAKGGEITLAGFYAAPIAFAFPPAFMREARIAIAAEWAPSDMEAVLALLAEGRLSLGGLITHRAPAADAARAYPQAFDDPACLKMILDWRTDS